MYENNQCEEILLLEQSSINVYHFERLDDESIKINFNCVRIKCCLPLGHIGIHECNMVLSPKPRKDFLKTTVRIFWEHQ